MLAHNCQMCISFSLKAVKVIGTEGKSVKTRQWDVSCYPVAPFGVMNRVLCK